MNATILTHIKVKPSALRDLDMRSGCGRPNLAKRENARFCHQENSRFEISPSATIGWLLILGIGFVL